LLKNIKKQVQKIPCFHIANPPALKIVEIDVSKLGYGDILKQVQNFKEQILQFTSAHWNDCQKNLFNHHKRNSFDCHMHYKISEWFTKPKFFLHNDWKLVKEVL